MPILLAAVSRILHWLVTDVLILDSLDCSVSCADPGLEGERCLVCRSWTRRCAVSHLSVLDSWSVMSGVSSMTVVRPMIRNRYSAATPHPGPETSIPPSNPRIPPPAGRAHRPPLTTPTTSLTLSSVGNMTFMKRFWLETGRTRGPSAGRHSQGNHHVRNLQRHAPTRQTRKTRRQPHTILRKQIHTSN